MRRFFGVSLRVVLGLCLGLGIMVGYFGWLLSFNNYHEVLAGQLYRAGQVTPAEIAAAQAQDGIRSIINLRGAYPGSDWYDLEVAEAGRLGITHADFKMSALKELTVAEAQALIALMKEVPKPILIHCLQGVDRTGLAASLYLAGVAGADEDSAEAQLSVLYGHFSIPYISAAWAMNETWERMEPELGFFGS